MDVNKKCCDGKKPHALHTTRSVTTMEVEAWLQSLRAKLLVLLDEEGWFIKFEVGDG